MSRLALSVALALLAGCLHPAVSAGIQLRPETRTQCAAHCDAIGMRLAAVVLIRNSAGCVCEVREGSARATTSQGIAVAAGGQVIVLEEEEEQQRRQDEQQRQEAGRASPPYPGAPGHY